MSLFLNKVQKRDLSCRFPLLFLFRVAAFTVDCVADGAHDGEIFGRVFEHLGIAFSTFDVGVLGRFLKDLRKLIVLENLSVGRTGELAEFVGASFVPLTAGK